jgi:triphosphoribosyl-dephospho-CoA synthase
MRASTPLSSGQCATTACLLEVIAPKPGNVHRGADFEDVTFLDFAMSAVAIGPVFERAVDLRVGELVLTAMEATKRVTRTNTNLGLVLLMAPLAKISDGESLRQGAARVLGELTSQDAADVYAAIRLANPGGLGRVEEHDVASSPPNSLIEAMTLAADRDLVARQYTNNFDECQFVVDTIMLQRGNAVSLLDSIIYAHVALMSERPDSLIARKCGAPTSEKSAALAAKVISSGVPGDETYEMALADLDFWLRSDGHRRNPGTTADMIGAALFWLLRTGQIMPPFED